MISFLQPYRQLQKYIYYLIFAELLIQVINATFMILVNYYLVDLGYKDYQIAQFTSYRYISVLLLGIPFGMLYKRINLLPMIKVGTILFIADAIAIILYAPTHNDRLMHVLMFLFGVFLLMSHVVALPFLLRIVDKDKLSIALSLFFQTWATSIVFIGAVSFLYHSLFAGWIPERYLILFLFSISSIAILLLFKIPKKIQFHSILSSSNHVKSIPIFHIAIILLPTLIIAVGAGFCIPFFNLFFYYTYKLSSSQYASIVGFSNVLVFLFMLFTPMIRRKLGYKMGVVGIQSLGLLTLIILTWADRFFVLPYAMWIAIFFFIIRQPLMNSAQPLVAEYMLDRVGKENQPLVGSIEATIWSGSFWISSLLFGKLREMDMSYGMIFNITIFLYFIGIVAWYLVFRYFESRKA